MTVKKTLRAVVGLTLKDGRRIEPGEPLPADFKPPKWLIEQGKVK